MTRKGQVTIPLAVRRALGIEPGSEVERVAVDRHAWTGGLSTDEVMRMRGDG